MVGSEYGPPAGFSTEGPPSALHSPVWNAPRNKCPQCWRSKEAVLSTFGATAWSASYLLAAKKKEASINPNKPFTVLPFLITQAACAFHAASRSRLLPTRCLSVCASTLFHACLNSCMELRRTVQATSDSHVLPNVLLLHLR